MNKKNFSDPSFIEKLKNRDHEAMTQLVTAYTSHLYKAALGLGFKDEEAQDLAHQSILTFYEKVHTFEGRSHIRTYLFGIFYNKVFDARRAQKKSQNHDNIDEIMESKFEEDGHWKFSDSPLHPEKFIQAAEDMSIIEKCLQGLPMVQRMAFTLKVIEEKENEEICNVLDVSYTNLRQLLFRGKSKLRSCIEYYANK